MPVSKREQDPGMQVLDLSKHTAFERPRKRINDGGDVAFFLSTTAYTDILKFLFQLNASMFPRPDSNDDATTEGPAVRGLRTLLSDIDSVIEEAPPEPGPARFGNVAFRAWYELVESRLDRLLADHLPPEITELTSWAGQSHSPLLELRAYLLGSFGSSQRLDYGTGHELSFLAFLGCLWKLDSFEGTRSLTSERSIVLGVVKPYLELVRRLIKTYNLEPAGSHGVWGLDDHSFLPYIFGSAQLGPAIVDPQQIPSEGSAAEAPDPGDVVKTDIVEGWRGKNLYFEAIGFINDVKKGPFWEHSPMLYDISGVKAGWAKINKGMIKMYMAEVLGKFPVVQHFPFGSMFEWKADPSASAGRSDPASGGSPDTETGPAYAASGVADVAAWADTTTASTYGALAPTRGPRTGNMSATRLQRTVPGQTARSRLRTPADLVEPSDTMTSGQAPATVPTGTGPAPAPAPAQAQGMRAPWAKD